MTSSTAEFARKLKEFQDATTKAREEIQAAAKKAFTAASQDLFKLVPELRTVVWTQYTPYFNDGDECVFGVHGITFTNAGPDDSEFEELESLDANSTDKWAVDDWQIERKGEEGELTMSESGRKACKAFAEFINGAEDQMQAIFGNHCKVVLTAKGADVAEYDHD